MSLDSEGVERNIFASDKGYEWCSCVSAVRISPDMSIVRAYLSVFPSGRAEEIVKNINDNSKSIRFELGNRVRHQLRIIPELKFFVDDSLDYVERIDELLKK